VRLAILEPLREPRAFVHGHVLSSMPISCMTNDAVRL
jgi:hypothetical protein